MTAVAYDVAAARARFSSLQVGFAFFDAPGGTQVPDEVGEAIARALREASANLGAPYATGRARRGDPRPARSRTPRAFLGCTPADVDLRHEHDDARLHAQSRTAVRDLQQGDEILVRARPRRRRRAVGRARRRPRPRGRVGRRTDDLTRRLRRSRAQARRPARVVACALASNAVGSITDAQRIAELAREAGALSWIDAVHYAAHEPIDVGALGCDVLLCSPYKFCGPHLGLAYGAHELLESWRPYKARPAPSTPVGRRFETGTLPYELLAGFRRRSPTSSRSAAWTCSSDYERELGQRFLAACPQRPRSTAPQTMEGRVPTFLLNVDGVAAGRRRASSPSAAIGVWAHDNWYSLGLADRLPTAALRVGLIHYNTADEVDRLLAELGDLAAGA